MILGPRWGAKLSLIGPGQQVPEQCWVVTHRASSGVCALHELCTNSHPQTTDSITQSTHLTYVLSSDTSRIQLSAWTTQRT